ncbi:MAG: hypothetical protein SFU25_01225 [Candidatus Caenarcaniphilales bacterium]|nr:hypothetical protein [Candidatus Caenarcaniphilales bacterium]
MEINSSLHTFLSGFPIINFSSLCFTADESPSTSFTHYATSNFKEFSQEVVGLIDSLKENNISTLVVLDDAEPLRELQSELCLVKDHMNLSTLNPLLGPNDDSKGQRFFPVSDLYLSPTELSELEKVTVCGLNPGSEPTLNEKTILKIHSQAYCYNLVLCALIAAHRGIKVIGLVNLE